MTTASRSMPSWTVLFIAAAVGYISLSQEILWMRLLSYATGSGPEIFGHVLGVFLIGIAMGALLGRRICDTDRIDLFAFIGSVLIAAGIIYYVSVPIIAAFRELNYEVSVPVLPRGLAVAYTLAWLVAFLQGGIFTILCHAGVRSDRAVGVSVSWIYLANIVGSTAGPLLTGFVLLDRFTVQQNLLGISIATLVLGCVVLWRSSWTVTAKVGSTVGVLVLIAVAFQVHTSLFDRVLERLQGWRNDRYAYTIQNRSGIIAVESAPGTADTVYGSGMYDGRVNINPATNFNGIDRTFAITALHPGPKTLLEIGVSTGSWARILADYTTIKQMTIVEINTGYFEAFQHYPDHAIMLKDPHIDIVVDDGRRWLKRHPERKFDFIMMNTSWHWRSHSTGLLSKDFLELMQAHLNPGGVAFYNTTGNEAILYTAAQVFKHVTKYANFVAVSDSPFAVTEVQRRANLAAFVHDGKPVIGEHGPAPEMANALIHVQFEDLGEKLRAEPATGRLITDDNMQLEFKNFTHRPVGLAAWLEPEKDGHPQHQAGLGSGHTWGQALQRVYK